MIFNTSKYTKEVEYTLNLQSLKHDTEKAQKLKKYLGTQWHVYGLTSAEQLAICKNGFSFYKDDKLATFKCFDAIYHHSKTFEGKHQAFIYLDKHYKHIPKIEQLELLPNWVKTIDNWAHSDYLSKFLTRLLEEPTTSKKMLAFIKNWNVSPNLWERRQSLICLYYYTRTKTICINYSLSEKLITKRLRDEEYYVQKAVGWALRESYNAYPEQTFVFIEKNITSISPVAFTTCIEKMTDSQKLILKTKRKK